MIAIFEAKVIALKGASASGPLIGRLIKSELGAQLEALPQTDLEKLWNFLDTSHGAIVLREDESIMEEEIIYDGSGILRFHSRLSYLLEKKHGTAASKKLRELVRPIPKLMLEEHAGRLARAAELAKQRQKEAAAERIKRQQEGESNLLKDPLYLVDQLGRRVEELETQLRSQSR